MIKNQIFVLATAGPAAYVPLALYATGRTLFQRYRGFLSLSKTGDQGRFALEIRTPILFCGNKIGQHFGISSYIKGKDYQLRYQISHHFCCTSHSNHMQEAPMRLTWCMSQYWAVAAVAGGGRRWCWCNMRIIIIWTNNNHIIRFRHHTPPPPLPAVAAGWGISQIKILIRCQKNKKRIYSE